MAERINTDLGLVVADSACRSVKREAALGARGVACAIAFKRKRGQKALPRPLQRLNRMIASVRAFVEHPFAWMRVMGYRRVRYRGRRRDALDFALSPRRLRSKMLAAYNPACRPRSLMATTYHTTTSAPHRARYPPRQSRAPTQQYPLNLERA